MKPVYTALLEALAYACGIGISLQLWAMLPIALQIPLAVCILVLAVCCAMCLLAAVVIYSKMSDK